MRACQFKALRSGSRDDGWRKGSFSAVDNDSDEQSDAESSPAEYPDRSRGCGICAGLPSWLLGACGQDTEDDGTLEDQLQECERRKEGLRAKLRVCQEQERSLKQAVLQFRAADRATQLRENLKSCRETRIEQKHRLDYLKRTWLEKEQEMEEELHRLAAKEAQCQQDLDSFLNPETASFPGPHSLLFVESTGFTMVASLVIIANLVTIAMQATNSAYSSEFFWLNQFFLVFYIVELALKAALWQRTLLIGRASVVWWNWMDLIIVTSGVIEMWVTPILSGQESGSPFVTVLRCLRLLRLMRALKLVRYFLVTDTSWVVGERFQIFIMTIIVASSLFMGLECDQPMFKASLEFIYWEHCVLAVFLFELVVRLKHDGFRRFFLDPKDWAFNLLDFVVVVGGIVDQWLLPSVAIIQSLLGLGSNNHGAKLGKIMMLLRMARLLRIFRLVRLIKRVPQLFNLLCAVIEAMAGMVWVMLLTMLVLYFFAILAVKIFRDGLMIGTPPDDVAEVFSSVPEAIFVLFTVMDGHKGDLNPIFEWIPMMKVCFLVFVMLSEWCILSFLTAVVSENMISVTEKNKEAKDREMHLAAEQRRVKDLEYVFAELDEDNNGCVDMQEFEKVLNDDEKCRELCQAAKLSSEDLQEIFNLVEKNGSIHHEKFLETLNREGNGVTQRSMMMLDKRLAEVERKLTTASLRVDGAVIAACNGTYEEFLTHNNRPAYRNTRHTGAIIYFDLFWKMSDTNDLTRWRYRVEGNSELTSSTIRWVGSDEEAARGLPTITWEWRHQLNSPYAKLESRFEHLEKLILNLAGSAPNGQAARLSAPRPQLPPPAAARAAPPGSRPPLPAGQRRPS